MKATEPWPLAQSDPYAGTRADQYDTHHQSSLRNRLTSKREVNLLLGMLKTAGSPRSAIDVPCGAGRFWPAFAEAGVETLRAYDVSDNMIRVAGRNRLTAGIPEHLERCSAFDLPLADQSVDFIACMRFYHHLARAEDRQALLARFRRITRKHVAISLWVDGNLGGARRMRRQARKGIEQTPGYGKRICRPRAEVEQEFQQAGFRIVRHADVWPGIAMWRMYLLEVTGER